MEYLEYIFLHCGLNISIPIWVLNSVNQHSKGKDTHASGLYIDLCFDSPYKSSVAETSSIGDEYSYNRNKKVETEDKVVPYLSPIYKNIKYWRTILWTKMTRRLWI